MTAVGLEALSTAVVECRACPRLVAWREEVAAQKRAAYATDVYWGRPVPGFGDPAARLVIVGLAPAAHGANRTGRMFTGDRSGDWLYRALHRAGLASQPTSTHRGDGLTLHGAWVTAPVRCAPPGNRPTSAERDACAPWLDAELAELDDASVLLALGGFAFSAILGSLRRRGVALPRPRPRFGHATELAIPGAPTVVCSYHVSQQNTFTGRLTEQMLDAVVARAASLAGLAAAPG